MLSARLSDDRGFSLLESLIACTLLTVGVLSLAQLFSAATSLNVASRHATLASVLAAQKIEELRTLTAPAPGSDFLDARGLVLQAGGTPPGGTSYIRRWTVDPLVADPANAFVVQVSVAAAGRARSGVVTLITVRTRKSP